MWEYDAKIKNMCKRFGFGVINERLLIYIEIYKKKHLHPQWYYWNEQLNRFNFSFEGTNGKLALSCFDCAIWRYPNIIVQDSVQENVQDHFVKK